MPLDPHECHVYAQRCMTAKDANEARKALLALDDRTPQQRLLGEPPTWRSALAQRNR